MQCPEPDCGKEVRLLETFSTLVGYHSPEGHNHDGNCAREYWACEDKHRYVAHPRRSCEKCDWQGVKKCWCHFGEKYEGTPVLLNLNDTKYKHDAWLFERLGY